MGRAEIEVYSAGKYFKSFKDYQKDQDKDTIGNLEIKNSIIEEPGLSQQDQEKLNAIGYGHGINHVLVDFQKNWRKSKSGFILDADELEESIREAMSNKTEPTLLIFDSGKMRILSFSQVDKDKNKQ